MIKRLRKKRPQISSSWRRDLSNERVDNGFAETTFFGDLIQMNNNLNVKVYEISMKKKIKNTPPQRCDDLRKSGKKKKKFLKIQRIIRRRRHDTRHRYGRYSKIPHGR